MVELRNPNVGPRARPFYVVGYDPGGTTGWAIASWDPNPNNEEEEDISKGPNSMSSITLTVGQFSNTTEGHYKELYNHMLKSWSSHHTVEFVSEPFTYRQFANTSGEDGVSRGKVDLISAEYIGVMKLFCQERDRSLFLGFNASQAKSYVTDKKLEKIGWLQKPITPKRHINDALRQVVKYLVVKKHVKHPITTSWRD